MKRVRSALIGLGLLIVALCLRLPGLGTFLTPDEGLWAGRSAQFLMALQGHDWAATNITGHPGVTTAWAGSLGMALKWLFARPAELPHLADMARALAADPVRLDFLPWIRLPVVVACALGIVLVYFLLRRLAGEATALLGAAFLSLDPFMLAHSRVLQMDALLATGMTIAWLALLVGTHTRQRRYFVLSGLATGAAILTKSPALVMGPPMAGWLIYQNWRRSRPLRLLPLAWDMLALGVPALLVIFAFWPALWVAPITTAERVWGLMTTYSEGGHELGNYWLGQEVASPGAAFYLATLLWRLTPVTLPGLLFALMLGGSAGSGRAGRRDEETWAALLLFVLWFGAIISLGDKKFDRYLLPIFPAVDLLAAMGWIWLGGRFMRRPGNRTLFTAQARRLVPLAGAGLLVAAQAWSPLTNRPAYFTAYNPLLGGIRSASRTFLVGWGEGLAEAADYLNHQPGAATGRAAAWYGQNVFGAFYKGQSYDLYYDTRTAPDLYANDVDYVVTYMNQLQRDLLDASVQERLGAPLFTSQAHGVPLAQVFAWPKPFGHSADRVIGQGLRLLGWDLGTYDPVQGNVPVTLYWDAAALGQATDGSPRMVIWMKDAAGEVWAQADNTLDGTHERRVTAWLGRESVAQDLRLPAPPALLPGSYRIEVAPFGGNSLALGAIQVEAARLDKATGAGGRLALRDARAISETVVFGNQFQLAGYNLEQHQDELVLDLLWAIREAPAEPHQLFVHLTDGTDRIVAQYDGPLGRLAGYQAAAPATWRQGDLIRQRIHLALPAGELQADGRLYVGVYRPADGTRLSASVDGAPVPDGRYLLADLGSR